LEVEFLDDLFFSAFDFFVEVHLYNLTPVYYNMVFVIADLANHNHNINRQCFRL